MTKEGQYLSEQGFVPHQMVNGPNGWDWRPVESELSYSTMSGIPGMSYLTCLWKKGDLQAITGLYEYGHPPRLVCPRPLMVIRREGNILTWSETMATDVDRMIAKYGIAEVLRAGWAGEILEVPTV